VVPLAIGIPLAVSGVNGLEIAGTVILIVGLFVGWPIYAAATEARSGEHAGQTFGKQVTGIRVIRDNGEPFGFGFGLLRELAVRWGLIGFVGGFFFFPPLLDVLWPIWDETNRSLHDMVVSTHVVRADEGPPTGAGGLPTG
jgi:uncharacterized RDD family membrane protein YckC